MSWSVDSAGIWSFLGKLDLAAAMVLFPAPNRPADGNVVLTASGLLKINLLAVPGAARTATLKSTSPAPTNGQMQLVGPTEQAGAFGGNIVVQREDATAIFTIAAQGQYGLFIFEGGVWRGVTHVGGTVGAGW